MSTVVCVGEASVEWIGALPRLPLTGGGRHELSAFSLQGGGAAANMAATVAKLGMAARYGGDIPEGFLGDFILASLSEAEVDVRFVRRSTQGVPPVAFVALEQERGARTIFFSKGEGAVLSVGDLAPELLEGAALLIVDGTSPEAQRPLVRRARAAGLRTLLDAHQMGPGMRELAADCEVIVASERFTRELSPLVPQGLERLLELGPSKAVVTLGEDGAVGQERGGDVIRQDAFPVRAVDTTGAGDVFRGAFAWALLSNKSLREAIQFASAAAALSCRHLGAREGLPTLTEVEQALADR
jgi:sulfofructose kinase